MGKKWPSKQAIARGRAIKLANFKQHLKEIRGRCPYCKAWVAELDGQIVKADL